MQRTVFAVFAGFSLLAGAALADPPDRLGQDKGSFGQDTSQINQSKGDTSQVKVIGTIDEPKKYLSVVDLYLENAMNNVKVLYESTQMKPGRADETIQREAISNIDRSLSQALNHFQHVKSMPGATETFDKGKGDDFQHNLYQAKSLLPQLRTAVKSDSRTQIQGLSTQLFTCLKNAGDTFGDFADKQKFTRIKDIDVPERQPVRGEDNDEGFKGKGTEGQDDWNNLDRGQLNRGGRFQDQSPDQMPRPSNTGDLEHPPVIPDR